MLPSKRCSFALCRAFYTPETKRSQYCSDNCRTRASLRRHKKAYTDTAPNDKENLFGIVPLRKRALWKLHFTNPELLEKITQAKGSLEAFKIEAESLQAQENIAWQEFKILCDAYLELHKSKPIKLESFASLGQVSASESSGKKSLLDLGVEKVSEFTTSFIDWDQEQRYASKINEWQGQLEEITSKATPINERILTLQEKKKQLNQSFLDTHTFLQQTITTLNKSEPQPRKKRSPIPSMVSSSKEGHDGGEWAGRAQLEQKAGKKSPFKNVKEVLSTQGNERLLLNGPLGTFLGKLERHHLAITLSGQPGGGKTHLCFQLAKALCEQQLKVIFFSIEEGIRGSFTDKVLFYGLDQEENFYSADGATLALLEEAAKEFDVILLDSWTVMGEKNETFGKFVSSYPRVIFISVFQQTSGGEIRGGSQPIFDSSINLEIKKGVVTSSKNRYGGGGEYTIFST